MGYNYPEDVLSCLFCSQPDEGKKIKKSIASARSFDSWWLWCHFPSFLAFNRYIKHSQDTDSSRLRRPQSILTYAMRWTGRFGRGRKHRRRCDLLWETKTRWKSWVNNSMQIAHSPLNSIEQLCAHCHAIKSKSRNHHTNKIKNLEDKYANILAKIQVSAFFL